MHAFQGKNELLGKLPKLLSGQVRVEAAHG
jgi:hypothetical protein